jgi:hypothetical protein
MVCRVFDMILFSTAFHGVWDIGMDKGRKVKE